MSYGLLSRKDSGPNKCPNCRLINVDFLIVGDGLLGCRHCGCVFVRKERRNDVVRPEIPVSPVPTENAPKPDAPLGGAEAGVPVAGETNLGPETYACEICGKPVKTKLALSGHMRSHKK